MNDRRRKHNKNSVKVAEPSELYLKKIQGELTQCWTVVIIITKKENARADIFPFLSLFLCCLRLCVYLSHSLALSLPPLSQSLFHSQTEIDSKHLVRADGSGRKTGVNRW